MKRRFLAVLLCAAMATTMFAGCGKTETEDGAKQQGAATEEKVTLSIYAQYADDDTKVPYDYAVEELKKAYPNVTLNLIIQAQDDGTTLKTLASTDQLPDIFQANTNIIDTLKKTNQVMVLDDVAKTSGYLDKLPESNKSLVYDEDGHIYCFPYAGNEYVLWYYNKAVFQKCGLEVPKTYDELLNCIKVFKQNNIIPMALFGAEGWITTAMYDAVLTSYAANGIKALDEKKASVKDAAYVEAADMVAKLAAAGMFQESVASTNYDQASTMFLNGEAAMFLNGQWYIADAEKALGSNVDWMFYPAKDAATYETAKFAFSGGGSTSGYAVNPNGEHAELAAKVAEFLSEKYCEAKIMYRGNPLVALNVDVKPNEELPAMMTKLSETIPAMTSTTKFTWGLTSTIFNDSICKNSQGLISGQYTQEEFTKRVDSDMSRMK